MKKTTKFIALLVAITMLFSAMSMLLSSSVYADDDADESVYVCTVDGTKFYTVDGTVEYESVQEAIDKIESPGTIKLNSDVEESILIPSGKTITLNLNGYKITDDGKEIAHEGEGMKYAATIENEGTLTITGSGTVDCTKANCATVMNYMGGTLTIESGTYLHSSETGSSWEDDDVNSCYVIINDGTMVINGGTFTSSKTLSSLVINGYRDAKTENESGTEKFVTATLTINGGTFSGGDSTIKSGDYGELIINGGTFTNTNDEGSCIQVYENCTINGGTFNATSNVIEFAPAFIDDGRQTGGYTLTITGGTFTSTSASAIYVVTYAENSIIIEGGTFNNVGDTITIYQKNLLDIFKIETNIEIYCGTFSNLDSSVTDNLAEGAVINENGHVHSPNDEGGVVVPPTCEEDGYTYYTCKYCGDTYSDSYVDALGHDWDEGVVTKEATEDEDGEITYTCLNDSTHTYTEVIPALGSEEEEDVNKSDSGEAEDVTDEGTSVLPNTGDIVLGAWVALIVVAGVAFAFTFKKSRK